MALGVGRISDGAYLASAGGWAAYKVRRMMRASLRWVVSLLILAGLVLLWQGVVVFYDIPTLEACLHHGRLPRSCGTARDCWHRTLG